MAYRTRGAEAHMATFDVPTLPVVVLSTGGHTRGRCRLLYACCCALRWSARGAGGASASHMRAHVPMKRPVSGCPPALALTRCLHRVRRSAAQVAVFGTRACGRAGAPATAPC
jgi:hypothetical protein